MTITVLIGPVIAQGEALSEGLDCSAGQIVKITMPADWTTADLTFQTSSDGQGYNDIYQADGNELKCTVRAGTAIVGLGLAKGWIKFRSGTSEQPVVQPARREFAVAVEAP